MARSRMILIALLICSVCVINARAYAPQGGSTKTTLSGTVVDPAGGVIPGATVVVKNNDNGVSFTEASRTPRARSPCRRSIPARIP